MHLFIASNDHFMETSSIANSCWKDITDFELSFLAHV